MSKFRLSRLGICTIALAITLLVPATASTYAAPSRANRGPTTYGIHDSYANADWETTSGSVETTVSLFAANNLTRDNGAPSPESKAMISVYEVDTATWNVLVNIVATVDLPAGAFSASRNSATLNTTQVTAHDWVSGNDYPMTVSGTWTRTGTPTMTFSMQSVLSPSLRYRTSSRSVVTPASATATLLLNGANLTPTPTEGEIHTLAQGTLSVTN